MTSPLVSVIMSVYNGARDMPTAVRSILDQTFRDFEFIAIDNGSFKDNSRDVLNELAATDPRLIVVPLDKNIGLAGALNHGISLARGRYVARQDHDDIARPERLAKQVAFLDANPLVGLLGTRAEIWSGDMPTARNHDHATDNASLHVDLLSNNPFVHTSIMVRKSALDTVGGYTSNASRQPPEDYELWSRVSRRYQVANLPERLVVYREVERSMSRDVANPFVGKLILISSENIAYWNGMSAPDVDCRAAACLIHAAYEAVPPAAGLEAVCDRMTTAVDAIVAANPGCDLDSRKAQLLANVRHHYLCARKIPSWMAPMVDIARRLPIPAGVKHQVVTWLAR